MAERKFFRTTFRGFSKEDVLSHIDTLRAQQQEELKDMQAQVDLAQQESAAARAEADAVIALPSEQLAELEQLRQAVASYKSENAQLKRDLEESNRALAALWEQQNHLQAYITRADELIVDTQAISAQLAARLAAYGQAPAVTVPVQQEVPVQEEPVEEEPVEEVPVQAVEEEPAPATEEEVTDEQPALKGNMADWLY